MIFILIRTIRELNSNDDINYTQFILSLFKSSLHSLPPESVIHIFASLLGYNVEYQDTDADRILIHTLKNGFLDPLPSCILLYIYRYMGNCILYIKK